MCLCTAIVVGDDSVRNQKYSGVKKFVRSEYNI